MLICDRISIRIHLHTEFRGTKYETSRHGKELNRVEINCVRKGHSSSAKRRSRQRNNISARALKVRRTAVDPTLAYFVGMWRRK